MRRFRRQTPKTEMEKTTTKSSLNQHRPHNILSPPTAKKQCLDLLPLSQEEVDDHEIITLTVNDDVGISCQIDTTMR